MNKRVLVILLSAFVIASISSYVVYRVVGKRMSTGVQNTTRVVVAAKDIKLGTVLRDADIRIAAIAGSIPKGAILNPRDAVGRGVISNLYEGEMIMADRLAAVGSGGGLAATITPGMRACAVKVDDVVGVAGFVTAGMRVDVLISGNPPGLVNTGEGPRVKTLLQNIEVLSAGTDIQKDGEGKPKPVQVVNLMVTPAQAEVLSLASNQTHIQLVLRNPMDTQIAHPPGSAMGNLFANANVETPKLPDGQPPMVRRSSLKPTSRVYVIQVFNGSKRTEEKFVAKEGKQ